MAMLPVEMRSGPMEPGECSDPSNSDLTRILMTADCVGGVWTYALDVAVSLAQFGVEIGLATMGPRPSQSQKSEAAQISNLKLFESDYKLEWMESPWSEVDAAGIWLLELAKDFDPQIVHLNGYVHASLPWEVPVVVVAHSCVRSWWQAVKAEPVPVEFAEYTKRVSKALRRANLVIAPTQSMLDAICQNYELVVPKKVLPNGRAQALFFPGQKKDLILTAGRLWDEAKGLQLLEHIAPRLKWPLYAAGENRHPSGSHRPPQNIGALGYLNSKKLAESLSVASIYAAPALYEPFGLTVLEAALSGCALVLSDIPSFRENWSGAAILIPGRDQDSWCAALDSLIENPQARSALAQKAQSRAAELRPDEIGIRYITAYTEVLASHASTTLEKSVQ